MPEEIIKENLNISCKTKDEKIKKKAKKKKIINQLKENAFKQKIEYVSNHVGLCTLVFTILIGVSSVLFKGFIYVYTCGKYDYLGISHTYINISNENVLYEVFFVVTIGILYIAFNAIPFFILISDKKRYEKLLWLIILLIFTIIVLFFVAFGDFVIQKQGLTVELIWKLMKCIFLEHLLLMLILSLVLYFLGVVFAIIYLGNKNIDKKEPPSNQDKKMILWHKFISIPMFIAVIFSLALYVLIFYYFGKEYASDERKYKTIGDNHVIVFENKTNFLISECIVDEENNILTVKKGIQKLISKEGVETETKEFGKVNIKDN